jgi:RNA polymerase sigma-70 factor (ECF subfamily)
MSSADPLLAPAAIGIDLARGATADAGAASEVLRLFDVYQRPLLRYAASFGLTTTDAEDVVQETFLALFRHLLRDRPRHNLTGWLFQVTRNLALKQRRRRQRNSWVTRFEIARHRHPADPAPTPEQCIADQEQQQQLMRVLGALPERDRQCVLLRAEGMTYREIASALQVSLGAVAKSITRALERFEHAQEG